MSGWIKPDGKPAALPVQEANLVDDVGNPITVILDADGERVIWEEPEKLDQATFQKLYDLVKRIAAKVGVEVL